ncbi:MAG: TolC family protein [Deltaproteobacteria bacterium]|nr:TolC family protein [Deltaproteobacteria bacterium]
MTGPCCLLLCAVTQTPPAAPTTLTLPEAEATAKARHPQIRSAHAATVAAEARLDAARAPLLPQLQAAAGYQRGNASFAARTGTAAFGAALPSTGGGSHDYFSLGLSGSLLVYDFGQAWGRSRAAAEGAAAQQQAEHTTWHGLLLAVRTAYFDAGAARAMVAVAREALANQERHLVQIQGFVEIGTRPAIDLAQVRTDRANARLQLITAENSYATSRAVLNQAMGRDGPVSFEVGDWTFAPVPGEDDELGVLVARALENRPEFRALTAELRAREALLAAARGGYFPSLSLGSSITDAGSELRALSYAWSAGATLTWPLFEGGKTRAAAAEAAADLAAASAAIDSLRQQVMVDVDQARLGVRAAKESRLAADEAAENARLRLRLAEGRYETGVGNVIELGDAQLALTNAAAQQVRADYSLATTRAQLHKALGYD